MLNLMEELRDNFEIEIAEPNEKFTRIIGDEQFTYDRAVTSLINKIKELGYLKLILAYRPLPYVNIHDCKYTAMVCLKQSRDFLEKHLAYAKKKNFGEDYIIDYKKNYEKLLK